MTNNRLFSTLAFPSGLFNIRLKELSSPGTLATICHQSESALVPATPVLTTVGATSQATTPSLHYEMDSQRSSYYFIVSGKSVSHNLKVAKISAYPKKIKDSVMNKVPLHNIFLNDGTKSKSEIEYKKSTIRNIKQSRFWQQLEN